MKNATLFTREYLDAVVADFRPIERDDSDDELRLVEMALYLEDCLGIVLSDEEMRSLGKDPAAALGALAGKGRAS